MGELGGDTEHSLEIKEGSLEEITPNRRFDI